MAILLFNGEPFRPETENSNENSPEMQNPVVLTSNDFLIGLNPVKITNSSRNWIN